MPAAGREDSFILPTNHDDRQRWARGSRRGDTSPADARPALGPRSRIRRGLLLVGAALIGVVPPCVTGCDREESRAADVRRVIGGLGLGRGEFNYPRSLAISPVDGRLFVVDKSRTARIQRFSPDGEYETEWHMPEYDVGKPTGLYVDGQGRVWVADTHYHRVIVFDRDGHELFRFGEEGTGPGQFALPTCVTLDRDGCIYVGEYSESGLTDRISKFSPDRRFLLSFAGQTSGEAAVQRPTEIIIDENDILWVADACHHRICRYDRDGRFLSAFGTAGRGQTEFKYPYGMVLEKAGTLLIADRGNNRIVRYDRSGRFLGSWGTPGRAVGQISQPWDVAVGKDGLVYCLDSYNNRVQVIDW